jgi:D-alanyl-D-alanine carboxypeptidase
MQMLSRLCFAAWLLARTTSLSVCAEPPKSFDIKAIDAYLASQVKTEGFVGLSAVVMKDGKMVLAKSYGKASVKTGAEVGTNTLFGAGSITKQFVCVCVLMLAEEGKLSVQDKVAKYYPDLARATDVTLYDLMTHVSGYRDYAPLDFMPPRMAKPIAPDKLIQEHAVGKLDFEPGTRWSYSNTGYIILGRIVEKVSGKPLRQLLAERIFQPLGMKHSAFDPPQDRPGLAAGHTSFALGEPEIAPWEADGWNHAAGGLFTTPSDLGKWDLALMEGKLIKPESFRLMTTPRKLADGRTEDYGCGLRILRRDGELILRHGGSISGFLASTAMIPRTKSAVILMTNCDHLNLKALNEVLLTLLLKAEEVSEVPTIRGPGAKETALALLHQLQSGKVERANLGEDFSLFLTPKRVEDAKERLKALGEPTTVEVDSLAERGGMEEALIFFTFKRKKVKAYLSRTPDGKIQQFLLYKG